MPTEILALLKDYGLPGLTVVLVLLGWLIPKRTHEREISDKDKQIAAWREAHAHEQARADLAASQVGRLMELSETTVSIVKALPRARETA